MTTPTWRSDCARCTQHPHCLGTAAAGQIPGRRLRIPRDHGLYLAGDAVGNRIYGIRSGSFKLVQAAPYCGPQVVGFALAPDFLGLNAMGAAQHAGSAIALEDSEVCVISWDRQQFQGRRQPLQRAGLHRLVAADIRRAQRTAMMLRTTRADQRLADLMLMLSRRHSDNGYSSTRFRLPMTRFDIGSYLGVTGECVSRLLIRFRRDALLDLDQRDVTLLDMAALRQLAACEVH